MVEVTSVHLCERYVAGRGARADKVENLSGVTAKYSGTFAGMSAEALNHRCRVEGDPDGQRGCNPHLPRLTAELVW
jgi:hypothetical protein